MKKLIVEECKTCDGHGMTVGFGNEMYDCLDCHGDRYFILSQPSRREIMQEIAAWQRFYNKCRQAVFSSRYVEFRLTARLRRAEKALKGAQRKASFLGYL